MNATVEKAPSLRTLTDTHVRVLLHLLDPEAECSWDELMEATNVGLVRWETEDPSLTREGLDRIAEAQVLANDLCDYEARVLGEPGPAPIPGAALNAACEYLRGNGLYNARNEQTPVGRFVLALRRFLAESDAPCDV